MLVAGVLGFVLALAGSASANVVTSMSHLVDATADVTSNEFASDARASDQIATFSDAVAVQAQGADGTAQANASLSTTVTSLSAALIDLRVVAAVSGTTTDTDTASGSNIPAVRGGGRTLFTVQITEPSTIALAGTLSGSSVVQTNVCAISRAMYSRIQPSAAAGAYFNTANTTTNCTTLGPSPIVAHTGTLGVGVYTVQVDARVETATSTGLAQQPALDGAAAADITVRITPTPVGCGTTVQVGRAVAEGNLVETAQGSGVWRAGPGQSVYVGGIELRPRIGGALVVDPQVRQLREEGAGVDAVIHGVAVPLAIGLIPVDQPSAQVVFNRNGTLMKSVFDFPVSGLGKITWTDGGRGANLEFEVDAEALIARFGRYKDVSAKPSLKLAVHLANCTGAQLSSAEVAVSELLFEPLVARRKVQVGVRNVIFKYSETNGIPSWTAGGEVVLPISASRVPGSPGISLGGNATVTGGEFAGAGVAVGGINQHIGQGVFLQRVSGNLATVPKFGFDMGVDATLGPVISGKQLVELTGSLKGFANAAADCPNGEDPIALVGTATIPSVASAGAGAVKLNDRGCLYATSTAMEKSIQVDAAFGQISNGEVPNPYAAVQGNLRGFAGTQGIEVEGGATITVPMIGSVGGQGLLSNTAVAGCARISFFSGGVVHRWTSGTPPQVFTGCDLGQWRVGAVSGTNAFGLHAVTAGGSRSFSLVAGLPFAAFSVVGADAAPRVRLTGPNGARFTSPTDGRALVGRNAVIVPVAHERRTYVFVRTPRAGAWTLSVTDGQATREFASANGLAKPRVSGRISGGGATRTLRYSVVPLPGQVVTFYERTANGVARRIGKARGASGTLTFTPTSTGQRARIEAVITQDGLPRDISVIARFTARLMPPAGLGARRAASALIVTWRRDRRAAGYVVEVRANNRRIFRTVTVATRVRIPSVPRSALQVVVVSTPVSGPASVAARRMVGPRR